MRTFGMSPSFGYLRNHTRLQRSYSSNPAQLPRMQPCSLPITFSLQHTPFFPGSFRFPREWQPQNQMRSQRGGRIVAQSLSETKYRRSAGIQYRCPGEWPKWAEANEPHLAEPSSTEHSLALVLRVYLSFQTRAFSSTVQGPSYCGPRRYVPCDGDR